MFTLLTDELDNRRLLRLREETIDLAHPLLHQQEEDLYNKDLPKETDISKRNTHQTKMNICSTVTLNKI